MADYISGVSEMPLSTMKSHSSHPSLGHLTLLVFEAVMEVVCVSLPGYIIARLGHFDADKQKFLANLNVMLFTPCLSMSNPSSISSLSLANQSAQSSQSLHPSWMPTSSPNWASSPSSLSS